MEEGVFPLSAGQKRLWWLQQLDRHSPAYNVPLAVQFPGGVDIPSLHLALAALVDRHEMLRVHYPIDHTGEPVHAPVPDFVIPLSIVDLVPDEPWQDRAAPVVEQPFDLTQAPAVRGSVLRSPYGSAILLLVAHHIAIDGRSLRVLVRDLTAVYEAARRRTMAQLPPVHSAYRDFVAHQRQDLDDSTIARQVEYWCEELTGFEPLEFPLDRTRPATLGFCGDSIHFELSRETTAAMKAFALRQRSAFSSAIAAVFMSLLAKRSGQQDITIGSVFEGRTGRDFEDIVGFFVNTVVLRAQITDTTAFGTLLRQVNTKVLGAYDHQDVPFDRVVAAVQPKRQRGRNAIFDVLYAHNGEAVDTADDTDRPGVRQVPFSGVSSRFDIELETQVMDGRLIGELTYRTDLYERSTMDSLAAGFIRLAEQVLVEPNAPLSRLSAVSRAEQTQILAESAGPDARPAGLTLPAAFAQQVAKTPDDTAVTCDGTALNYRELEIRANQLAKRLVNSGVRPDQVVAVLMDRSLDLVVALLAVVKAGAAYVPLGVTDPPGRLRTVLAESKAAVLIVDEAQREHPVAQQAEMPVVVVTPEVDPRVSYIDNAYDPEQLAYVIYTSGSTGVPKGVAVTHRDVVEFTADRCWDSGAHDRILLHTAHTFDVAQYELWVPLLRGGQVVVAPPGVLDVATLEGVIARSGVTAVWQTAGLFRLMAEESPGCFAGVREVWAGGDVVPPESVRRVLDHCPGVTVVNGYGPTETTVFSTSHRVGRPFEDRGPVPIGRPLDGTRCYVLGPEMELLPAGVVGELFIAGAGLARGYLHRPDLTADRFVADPHGPPGSRMYRTGDLVRRRADGELEFLGRADHQVKIRGFRIEIGEIEAVVEQHPHVAQVAVLAREEIPADKWLVAYVVAKPGSTLSKDGTAAIRAHAQASLPGYMVPSEFVVLDALPLTMHGKVDRRALPAPPQRTVVAQTGPRTPQEGVLCELFAEILGVPQIGVHDDFFALGGHSLLGIRLITRIRSVFGVDVHIGGLFEAPTVASFAERLGSSVELDPYAALLPLRPRETREPPLFFVHPAAGISWVYSGLLGHLDPDTPVYGLQDVRLTGAEAVPRSVSAVAANYLRQVRAVQPTGPYQLLGWSFGGLVAHAMATQLQAAGEQVAILAMFDAYPLHKRDTEGVRRFSETEALTALLESLGHTLTVPADGNSRAEWVDTLRRTDSTLASLDDCRVTAMAGIFADNIDLSHAHEPGVFQGDVLFFAATLDKTEDSPLMVEDWSPYVTGCMDVRRIACRHGEMMRPGPLSEIGPMLAAELGK